MEKKLLFTLLLGLPSVWLVFGQDAQNKRVKVKKGRQVILQDTIFVAARDTVQFNTDIQTTGRKFRVIVS